MNFSLSKTIIFLALILSNLVVYASDKPVIGLTASFKNDKVQLNYEYLEAIMENGGTPLILAPTDDEAIIEQYISMIDAVVLTGGRDIPPDAYGQKKHPTTIEMDPHRSGFEKLFIPRFLATGKPALGICLGMQFSNVTMSGTMYQDIPSMIGKDVCHRDGQMYTNLHPVGIAKGSRLEKILGTTSAKVISRHHQAIDKVAPNFVAVARTSDGIIEAIERKDRYFGVFVQWHPESMKKVDPGAPKSPF